MSLFNPSSWFEKKEETVQQPVQQPDSGVVGGKKRKTKSNKMKKSKKIRKSKKSKKSKKSRKLRRK
tara:strand:+ start:189 stop:386 length:198 start_codon:yes stop_codon:yes gene_type:complete